jgi:DNA-binding response OmpR family regulator
MENMKQKHKILVVEDDEALMLGLVENLRYAGYETESTSNGDEALTLALERKPDLILLDIMLPGKSGYEVCRSLRERGVNVPVVMLTARQDEFDKLHGFEVGADDYITKPFSVKELLARINAVLRRAEGMKSGPRRYSFGDCMLDLDARVLLRKQTSVDGKDEWKEIKLTRTEFELLAYFCKNDGRVISREEAMNEVWGLEYYGTQRSVDTFVAGLRAKIEKDPSNPVHILTAYGVGYKFFANPAGKSTSDDAVREKEKQDIVKRRQKK